MDQNEISFEAIFRSSSFKMYTSPRCEKAYEEFEQFLQSKFSNYDIRNKIETEANRCCSAAHESGFEQGFCFAVKLMKILYDI